LRDYLELETRKREREEQSRKAAKVASEAVADKVRDAVCWEEGCKLMSFHDR
jgi:hypothetical protein